tara:strand:- start:1147 stop:6846 length:5700 start_codon:yes stop_codon:yes gene_type:complete
MTSLLEMTKKLLTRHKEYVQAEYHIRHPRLIKERQLMLDDEESGTQIMAPLFLEAPPKYGSNEKKFNKMNLEESIKKVLTDFADNRLGVWNPPYIHQAEAIEEFLTNGKDLIVTTGTGSGKTEIFTYSTLGKIAKESSSPSKEEYGIRTLLLYPMNALVSDQLTRIRKMFGINADASMPEEGKSPLEILNEMRGKNTRPYRFAMYTGRTPYHGKYDAGKNSRHLSKLSDWIIQNQEGELGDKLQEMGRIPQKDMRAFRNYGGRARKGEFGGTDPKYRSHNGDTEYLSRQEMLDEDSRNYYGGGTPDLLITNYSMLEYMLIRPIEQPILEDTKNWLKNNPDEQILMVLDEAHLYRGSGGAEVALLLRRFMQRLGVGPERFRFILTSASFNDGAIDFASKLTGKKDLENWHQQGANPIRYGQIPVYGKEQDVKSLIKFGVGLENKGLLKPSQLVNLAEELGWEKPPKDIGEKDKDKINAELYLGNNLDNWDIFRFLSDSIGHPIKANDLCRSLFPNSDKNESLEAVLQLSNMASMARINRNGLVEPLLPTRLHLFFRGLPEHYICSSNICDSRRNKDGEFLGKIYLESRFLCECGCRTFRLETCRDCGTAYLRVNVKKNEIENFIDGRMREISLWTEEIEKGGCSLHVMPIPVEDLKRDYNDKIIYFLDSKTGKLFVSKEESVSNEEYLIPCLIGEKYVDKKINFRGFTFNKCGKCLTDVARYGLKIKIQDLETKGEQPLSNILAEIFQHQPEKMYDNDERKIPNKGKKVLVFSDSRAKASRLARSIQGDIEKDSFRTALLKSLHEQHSIENEAKLEDLYPGFLWYCTNRNLRFFQTIKDRSDLTMQVENLYQTIKEYNLEDKKMKDNIEILEGNSPQEKFYSNLLNILGDKYRSVYEIIIAYLDVDDSRWNTFYRKNKQKFGDRDEEEIRIVIRNILKNAAEKRAIGRSISHRVRNYSRVSKQKKGKPEGLDVRGGELSIVYEGLEKILINECGWSEVELENLGSILNKPANLIFADLDMDVVQEGCSPGRKVISMKSVSLKLDTKLDNWRMCKICLNYNHKNLILFDEKCPNCGSKEIVNIEENSPHVNTRMNFYRMEVIRKFDPDQHSFAIRAEEHTAQVNNRDSSINEGVFSRAEKYELEFQDVLIDEDAALGRDQPVDILSCTTTMEVGIDIGSLTAVAMRTVPPRPDNYQQRAGRAGRRGSAMSTIVTYANNSPHEQHFFLNPDEIIGASTNDPFLQIDNKRLSERHVNAMLFQIYFTEIIDTRDSDVNVFESIGLTEVFFNNNSEEITDYPEFKKWIQGLDKYSKTTKDIITLLPTELGIRLHGEILPEEWKTKFVISCVDNLIRRLDVFSDKFTEEIEKRQRDCKKRGVGFEIDNENKLIEFLLRKAFLPSFAFPIDVCNFEILKTADSGAMVDSLYSPSQGVGQALSTYVPGQKIDIDKKTYQSGGIYIAYPESMENRFEGVVGKINTYIMHCHGCHSLTTWEEGEKPNERETCKNCGEENIITMPMYTPEAFAPLSNNFQSKEEDASVDEVKHKPSKVLLPISTQIDTKKMKDIFHSSKILCEIEKEFFQLNLGPEIKEGDDLEGQSGGWHFCDKCGTCKDTLKFGSEDSHSRPYPNIRVGSNSFSKTKCESNHWQRLALGYKFKTDMVLLRVDLTTENIDFPINNSEDSRIRHAAQSAIEAMIQAIVTSKYVPLDIDPSEISGHHRVLFGQGINQDEIYLEMYLFDTASGGAGFSSLINDNFEDVVDAAIEILDGCSCDSSCHKCLRNYSNKFYHSSLNRMWGSALLRFIQDGSIPELDIKHRNKLIRKIIIPAIVSATGGSWSAKIIKDNKLEVINQEGTKKELNLEIRLPFKPQTINDETLSIIDADIINNLPEQLERIAMKFREVNS